MATLRYRGYRIQPRPYQNHQTMLWTVDFEIKRAGRRKEFSLDERHATEREAEIRCLELARLTIDGKIDGWSVRSLRPGGFLSEFREGAKDDLARGTRTIINLGILMVIVFSAIMLLRGAYGGH